MADKPKDQDPVEPAKDEPVRDSFWDDDEIREAADTSQFIKFDVVGDTCTGVIKSREKGKDPWDRLAITFVFEDGRTAVFAQTTMVRDLFIYAPTVGETLTVKLEEIKSLGGGKAVKLFSGEITRLDGSVEKFDQTGKSR